MAVESTATIWHDLYQSAPQQLDKVAEIDCAVTAFNTNIDAVLKISGEKLSRLAEEANLSWPDSEDGNTQINLPRDVIRGAVKCFIHGIAEEWLCERESIYEWMRDNLGYDTLQMGGQAGIIANTLATLNIHKVIAHTNSHPHLQAQQFLNRDNLFAINNEGKRQKACELDYADDLPLVHWIIEFAKDDVLHLGGREYVCPKANRFIATYDPANLNLQINRGFVSYLKHNPFDYLILSGYHNLMAARDGMRHLENTVPLIKEWKAQNPKGIIHLELASTQDKEIRRAVLEKIAPLTDSVGMNEREALDALEVVDSEMFSSLSEHKIKAADLCKILAVLKAKCRTPRMQLHMYGLYITLQDKKFNLSPEQNRSGMLLAAIIAAAKAGLGKIDNATDLLWALRHGHEKPYLTELNNLAEILDAPDLLCTGISSFDKYDLIAVPTILIDKPKTLVGMGDTISAISLLGAR